MRIEKLAASAALSRKEFKKAMAHGRITVNGTVKKGGTVEVDPKKDTICLDGKEIKYTEFVYLMLNKPAGVISATEDTRQRTVMDLLPAQYKRFALFPVGRLDIDTEGLLLITNDGQTAHRLLSPVKNVYKKYFVKTDDVVTEEDAEKIRGGVVLDDGYKTRPAKLSVCDDATQSYIWITEGRFHQVKRMFASVGRRVCYLKRVEFGGICLDQSLETGQMRELSAQEVEIIRNNMQNC